MYKESIVVVNKFIFRFQQKQLFLSPLSPKMYVCCFRLVDLKLRQKLFDLFF